MKHQALFSLKDKSKKKKKKCRLLQFGWALEGLSVLLSCFTQLR